MEPRALTKYYNSFSTRNINKCQVEKEFYYLVRYLPFVVDTNIFYIFYFIALYLKDISINSMMTFNASMKISLLANKANSTEVVPCIY